MRASVTQVLKTSRNTSRSASIEVFQSSMDAAFHVTKFEWARCAASERSSESKVEITQTTVILGMNEPSINHPAGPSQPSTSAKTIIPLPSINRGDFKK